jgi:hypothetical protein
VQSSLLSWKCIETMDMSYSQPLNGHQVAQEAGTFTSRVIDLIRACFTDSASNSRSLQLCLSEQAALSRCKWMISKYVLCSNRVSCV